VVRTVGIRKGPEKIRRRRRRKEGRVVETKLRDKKRKKERKMGVL
jgi:hypothetical protein